jgi:acyl phosphate:glycerol-3-phosphate acyltransferase
MMEHRSVVVLVDQNAVEECGMSWVLWTVLGFLSGSVPYAVLLGRWLAHREVVQFGDGNPGAANAWRAGGSRTGAPALILDVAKGVIPIALAQRLSGIVGWPLVPVSLAPLLGHAFSPFMRFRGGKAVAVTFGVWLALTLWFAPTILGAALTVLHFALADDAWSVVGGGLVLGLGLLARGAEASLFAVWLVNYAVLIFKHRQDLTHEPSLRPWIRRLLEGHDP